MKSSRWQPMEVRRVRISFSRLAIYSFSNSSINDFDFKNYYQPHVTLTHENHDSIQHFYSVMMIVEKGQKIYEIDSSSGYSYNVDYYFRETVGANLIHPIKTSSLNSKYELRIYKYPINTEAVESIGSQGGSQFEVDVHVNPSGQRHPHNHPDKLHKGTIHRPGGGFPFID